MSKELTPTERIQAAKEILALLESKEIAGYGARCILRIALKAIKDPEEA